MNRRPSRYATPELAHAARIARRDQRRREKEEAIAAKRHAELLEADRLAESAESAQLHDRELDAPE